MEHSWMMRTTKPFLKVYLSRATARVQEAMHIMGVESNSSNNNVAREEKEGGRGETSSGNLTLAKQVPSEKEVATYMECLRHELRTVRHDIELTNHLVRHVVIPSLHTLSDYLQTCRCMHSDVTNFDMTTFGSSSGGGGGGDGAGDSGVDGGRTKGSGTLSSSSSSSSSPSPATTTSMQQQQGRRRASLNSFQRHNCKLAYCTKTILFSISQISNELENELVSSTVSMKRAATWSTKKMLQYRLVSVPIVFRIVLELFLWLSLPCNIYIYHCQSLTYISTFFFMDTLLFFLLFFF